MYIWYHFLLCLNVIFLLKKLGCLLVCRGREKNYENIIWRIFWLVFFAWTMLLQGILYFCWEKIKTLRVKKSWNFYSDFENIKSWNYLIYVRGKCTLNCLRGIRASETAGLCRATALLVNFCGLHFKTENLSWKDLLFRSYEYSDEYMNN